MEVPGILRTLVVVGRAEGVQFGTRLLVRARVGGDVISLPLRIHRVGPRLCLVHLLIDRIHTGVQCLLRVEIRFGSQLALRLLGQEVTASGGHHRRHHQTT